MKKLLDINERQYLLLQQCYTAFINLNNTSMIKSRQSNFDTDSKKSVNALLAEKSGLYTLREIANSHLSELGFIYEPDFFAYLANKYYIKPKELHHCVNPDTGKISVTPFYCDSTITYVVEHYDLPFLFRLYKNEINLSSALHEKNITFCLVETTSEIVGIDKGTFVKVYCIRQKDIFWFSKTKYIKKKGNNLHVVKEWEDQNNEFINKNSKKIIRMLLSRKKLKLVKKNIKL